MNTCKNCSQFPTCDMWNYSYWPCSEWQPGNVYETVSPFEEDLSDGALD